MFEEICSKIKSFPLSDNTIDYVKEKLEVISNPQKYVSLLEELYNYGISFGKGLSIMDWPKEDIDKWDKEYDKICKMILNMKLKKWKCRYCGRIFNDLFLHNCNGTVRKRHLSFINKDTGFDTLVYPGEIYLYKNYFPIKVKTSRLKEVVAENGRIYQKEDLYPIRITLKELSPDVKTYKFGDKEFFFIKQDRYLVYQKGFLMDSGDITFYPNFFHQIQRIYHDVIEWKG